MRFSTVTTTAFFVSQVWAGILGDVAAELLRRDNGLEETTRRFVDSIVEPIQERQAAPPFNVAEWDSNTTTACTTTLQGLNGVASNPSGMAVCYNLPSLDNATGVFQADLRVFQISEPTGPFAGISSQDISVGLAYVGAAVSAVDSSEIGRREVKTSLISWPRASAKRQAPGPNLLQAYAFVGQVNKDLLQINGGTSDLQKVLVPTVTLTGTNAAGQQVNTTLASNEATFVSGTFSSVITPTRSEVMPPIQTLVVAPDRPFIVPGLNILIFPIGGVITGIWALVFIGTISYGTYGRMQFRESYRRRAAVAVNDSFGRI